MNKSNGFVWIAISYSNQRAVGECANCSFLYSGLFYMKIWISPNGVSVEEQSKSKNREECSNSVSKLVFISQVLFFRRTLHDHSYITAKGAVWPRVNANQPSFLSPNVLFGPSFLVIRVWSFHQPLKTIDKAQANREEKGGGYGRRSLRPPFNHMFLP